MKETENRTNPASSWCSEDGEEKPSGDGLQEGADATPTLVDEKRLAQRRTAEKTDERPGDPPNQDGQVQDSANEGDARENPHDSTPAMSEKERIAGGRGTSRSANERANILLDYVERAAMERDMDGEGRSNEKQERKSVSVMSERERIASRGDNKTNRRSPTNQGGQVQDHTNTMEEVDSRENDPRRKNIGTSASVLEEKERITERNSPESLQANRNAKIMLDYIDRGEAGNVDPRQGPRASTNHRVGSLDHDDLPMSREQDTSIHSFPGSVRVPGIDTEREGSIRILSDPPNPTAATSNNDLLVHAHVVDGENSGNIEFSKVLATATPDPWWRRHQWWLAGGAIIIIGSIIAAVILTTVEFGTPTTESPSMAPTSYSKGVEDRTVQLIESVLPLDVASRLSDVSSPQYSALQWVIAQRLENEEAYWDSMVVIRHYSLAVLFFGTGGVSSWVNADGWLNSTSVCEWYGVQCSLGDNGDEAVTSLNLTSNGLNGTISSDIAILAENLRLLDLSDNDLSGTIPEQIGGMTALTHLSLAENSLSGSFPPSFGGMTNLLNLDLSANSLGSTLPTELGFLTSLEELRLAENDLVGEIPSQIGQLTALENVDASENRLSYALPSELGRMTFLKSIDAHGNTLLGPLPTEIGLLGSLRRLDLSENFIFDKIPSDLGRLTTLTTLELSDNLFTGTLLAGFGVSMNQLSSLRVSGNFLEGTIDFEELFKNGFLGGLGSSVSDVFLPDDFLELDSLTELDLSSNLFSGSIPTIFYSLPTLESLNVSSNRLSGSMLQGQIGDFGDLSSNLTVLDVSSNVGLGAIPETIGILSNMNIFKSTSNFAGSLPTEIALLTNLVTLDVITSTCDTIPTVLWSMTTLESLSLISEWTPITNCNPSFIAAPIPGEVGALTHLRELRIIHGDGITGSIPSEFGLLTNLTSLGLESIGLSGSLPSELGRLSLLTSLSVAENRLSGTLPTEVGMLKQVQLLSMKNNFYLSGSIPTEIAMLTRAETLDMLLNNFLGTVPSEIGMMTNLRVLELGRNSLSGNFPTEAGMLTNLNILDLGVNALSGTLPTQLGVLSNLNVFDLESNVFRGQLPSEIGLLEDLVTLSLKHNVYLNGTIPSEIGLLTKLADLFLQSNSLNGSLPSEIGLMTLLERLSASDNFLIGSIPSEIGQLSNLLSVDLSNNTLSGLFLEEIAGSFRWDISNNEISGSISDKICELSPNFVVDCEKVACSCCGCPSPIPSVQPSQSAVPTDTPTTAAPSSSLNPTNAPSLSFQPSNKPPCSLFSPIGSIGSRLVAASEQDDGVEVVALPFMFPWLGEIAYNNVTVASNGVVFPGVSSDNGCCGAFPILGVNPIPRIAVAQMDLSPQNGGSIYTAQLSDEAFMISWENVPIYGAASENDGLNFQVVLYASGNVEMRWGEGTAGFIIMASGLEDGAANVTAPVTGPPYNFPDQPGVTEEWPLNQCRFFETTLDGGYDQ